MSRLVILESPYAGQVRRNRRYARRALRDSLMRGEAPIASHLLYTQPGVLDDNVPAERVHGIDAGLAWGRVAEATVVYYDRGISRGMKYGIEAAINAGRPIDYRHIGTRNYFLELVGSAYAWLEASTKSSWSATSARIRKFARCRTATGSATSR